ncbi:MAG: T9SS type A sorting domain-containing protein [Salibacteraceae bacterium]
MRYYYSLIVAVFFFLFSGLLTAQLTLEHQYSTIDLEVIELQNQGSRYVFKDYTNQVIELYTPDHQLWRSFAVNYPSGSAYHTVSHVSDRLFNTNNELEYLFMYQPDPFVFLNNLEVKTETGGLLFTRSDVSNAQILEVNGAPKLFLSVEVGQFDLDVEVYSLPGFVLEHTFQESLIWTADLDDGQTYFYRYDGNSGNLVVYNPDYSLRLNTTFSVTPPGPGDPPAEQPLMSVFELDNDPELEVIVSNAPQNADLLVYDETVGQVANTIFGGQQVTFFEANGKNWLRVWYGGFVSGLVDPSTLTLEHSFNNGYISRIDGDDHPVPFAAITFGSNKQVEKFATDFSLVNTFNLSGNGTFSLPYEMDHQLFHWNNELEILHIDWHGINSNTTLILESESGVIYNQIPDIRRFRLEELNGETKVLVWRNNNTTEVYRPGPPVSVATVSNPQTDFSLFPNPAKDQVQVQWEGSADWQTARIFNLQGQELQAVIVQGGNGNSLNLSLENLAPGYYQLQMSGPEGNKVKPFVVN